MEGAMTALINILIVEDNPHDFLLFRENIEETEEFEAAVHHAELLEDGMALLENTDVDVAILDLSLPDSSGLETFSTFHEKHPSIPAVILSGQKDDDLALQAIKKGAQDYLFKGEPSQAAMIRIIRHAIERQRLTTELRSALDQVKQLQGLLPICSHCKSIRDDKGYWNRVENYISRCMDTKFSHGICPDCTRRHYPDIYSSIYHDDGTKKE